MQQFRYTINEKAKSNVSNLVDAARKAGKVLAKDPKKNGDDARKERNGLDGNKLTEMAFDEGFREGVKESHS